MLRMLKKVSCSNTTVGWNFHSNVDGERSALTVVPSGQPSEGHSPVAELDQ